MLFICKIHNNCLGRCLEVASWEEGKDLLRIWAEKQFRRELNDEEIDILENEKEICYYEDSDNIYTFSFGIAESL